MNLATPPSAVIPNLPLQGLRLLVPEDKQTRQGSKNEYIVEKKYRSNRERAKKSWAKVTASFSLSFRDSTIEATAAVRPVPGLRLLFVDGGLRRREGGPRGPIHDGRSAAAYYRAGYVACTSSVLLVVRSTYVARS